MSNVTRIIENSIGFIEELRNASDAALNASAVSFENILGSLYPITYACYHSIYEYGEIGVIFGETLIDGLQLLYNMIHKLGNIYDCIYFLVKHHKNHPFKKKDDEEEEEEEVNLDDLTEEELAAFEAETKEYEAVKEEWWFKLGIYYGTLINLLLYTPEDWVEFDPTEDIENVVVDVDIE